MGWPPTNVVVDGAGSSGSGLMAAGAGGRAGGWLVGGTVGVDADSVVAAQAPSVAANPRLLLSCISCRRLKASIRVLDPPPGCVSIVVTIRSHSLRLGVVGKTVQSCSAAGMQHRNSTAKHQINSGGAG